MKEKIEKKDIISSLPKAEQEMIEKGKKHWTSMYALEGEGGYLKSETLKELMELIIEDVWVKASQFFKEN